MISGLLREACWRCDAVLCRVTSRNIAQRLLNVAQPVRALANPSDGPLKTSPGKLRRAALDFARNLAQERRMICGE